MWLNALVLSGGIVLLASPCGSAAAQENASAYTNIDANHQCSHARGTAVEDYGSWHCKGYAGIGVWLSAGDQRMYVSFGPRAATEIAARETLTPFNDFYKGVIEWRLEKQQDGKALRLRPSRAGMWHAPRIIWGRRERSAAGSWW